MRAVETNQSLTEGAYESLRADLLACRFAPGEKLNINDLSQQLKVSLGAVREALSRLTAEELGVLEAHRGFRAAPVSVAELHDLTSTRIELESLCLARAIAKGDVEWEAGIVAAFHRLSRTPERMPGPEARIAEDWARAGVGAVWVGGWMRGARARARAPNQQRSEGGGDDAYARARAAPRASVSYCVCACVCMSRDGYR